MTFPTTPAPTICHVCGKHAEGVGLDHNRWLCRECVTLASRIKDIRRWDPYELQALDGAVDAVGEYLAEIDKTELADFDELERRMLVKAAVQGFGDSLRNILESGIAPF